MKQLRSILMATLLLVPAAAGAQVCGDADGNGNLAGVDINLISSYLYAGGPE